ncbi:MAG: sugar-binding protein [Planctomycetota bacterium]
MKRFKTILIVLILAAVGVALAAGAKSASVLLQEGLYAEQVDGDLDAAIKMFEQVINDSTAQRPQVAQAMYLQGMCYLKKQDEQRAQQLFGRLVADFSDQTKIISKVKPLLEELGNADPAALMPPDTLFYLEIGSPGEQIETILKMLEGTPFENPLAAIGGGNGNAQRSTGGASPGNILGSLMNPGMMAEFKKIRGLGVGITGVTDNNPPGIVVLFPGKSDALRGIILLAIGIFGRPIDAIEGMQCVELTDGGGAAYDDTTVILVSPKAYAAGQLTWCVKQHKGTTREPTLASSNKSFAKIGRKARQENVLTVWADVDHVFAGLAGVFPAGQIPQPILMADKFADLKSIDDFIASLSIRDDGLALEANVALKDGHHCQIYDLIRTPKISKAALKAVPSEAIAVVSVGLGEADSAQSQALREKIRSTAGLDIGGDIFANIDQATLFMLPSEGTADVSAQPIPPIVTSLGLVMTSERPQETRQILIGLLTMANLFKSQSANEQPDQGTGRYQIELVTEQKIYCYTDQANKATILSLNPNIIESSVSAIRSRTSAAGAGPLNKSIAALSPATSKLVLLNVGGAMRAAEASGALGLNDSDDKVHELFGQLAANFDKTTIQVHTQEELNSLKLRAEISELPPVQNVLGPAKQLSDVISAAKAKARAEREMAQIPAYIMKASQPPVIDGTAEEIWSQVRRNRIDNTVYSPVSDSADLTAFYRAMWDENNLYVLVNVMDDVLKNDSDEFWLDDGVEVFIDADNSKSDSYGDNDYQYFFEWAEANPGMGEFKHGRTGGVEFAVGRADVGYRVEIKFPWSTLGTRPSAGTKIGLDVHVNDDDDGGDRDTKLTWRSKEDNAWQTPSVLGIGQLTGLVGWWKFDEAAGGTAADSSGAGNNGTLMGSPQWKPSGGKLGGALQFDGIDDYVDCGNDSSLDINHEITIAAWVRTNDMGNSQFNPYVTKGDRTYGLKQHSSNNLEFMIFSDTWHVAHLPMDGSFNGSWHHLAGTYDGGQLKLYVDGTLKVTTDCPGCRIAGSAANFNIGRNSEESDRFYDGAIDDVRIYNYAISEGEVKALYSPSE